MSKKTIGLWGEDYAAKHLRHHGFRILERNYRTPRWGELDIVAEEGEVLVFVEVKTRSSLKYGPPQGAVDFFKRRALKRAIDYFLVSHQLFSRCPCRLDLITVIIDPGTGAVRQLEHFRDVSF